MIDTLLTYINDNKGNQSIFLTNKDEASNGALRRLEQKHPDQAVTISQVENKVNGFFAQER